LRDGNAAVGVARHRARGFPRDGVSEIVALPSGSVFEQASSPDEVRDDRPDGPADQSSRPAGPRPITKGRDETSNLRPLLSGKWGRRGCCHGRGADGGRR
jgi:hypothetical protein